MINTVSMEESDAPKTSKKKKRPYQYQKKLNDMITRCLSPSDSIISVKFGFFQFGPLCNASESNSFTTARCNIKHIKKDEDTHYSLDFRTLFKLGFETLSNYKYQVNSKKLSYGEAAAIRRLEIFVRDKGKGFCIDITFTFTFKVVEIYVYRLHNHYNRMVVIAFSALQSLIVNVAIGVNHTIL